MLAAAGPLEGDEAPAPVVAVAPYGKGRSMAITTRFSDRPDGEYAQAWGEADNRYYEKFWLNALYWLTENSAIARRRLVASADKLLYRPGETIQLRAATYDESGSRSTRYRVEAMIEPQSMTSDLTSTTATCVGRNMFSEPAGERPGVLPGVKRLSCPWRP